MRPLPKPTEARVRVVRLPDTVVFAADNQNVVIGFGLRAHVNVRVSRVPNQTSFNRIFRNASADRVMKLLGGYAYTTRKKLANEFRPGEGLVGQCMLEKRRILLTNAPSDYIMISSGLGEAAPLNIVVLPAIFEEEVKGVIERYQVPSRGVAARSIGRATALLPA